MSLFHSLLPLSGSLPSDHVRRSIPSGKAGTAATIREMQRFVEKNKRNGRIKEYLYAMIGGCPQKDYLCYAKSIYEWVIQNTRYIWDPNQVEMVQDPFYVLSQTRVGDCDDMATLMAMLYEFIDLPARFVTVKADASAPGEYSHVFTEVKVPGRGWMGADTTMPQKGFGWVPPAQYPRKTWPATTERLSDPKDDKLEGLGMRDFATTGQPLINAPVRDPRFGGMRDYANSNQPVQNAPNPRPFLGRMRDYATTKQAIENAPVSHPFLGRMAEGPVPGVTLIPSYTGAYGDYRTYKPVRQLGAMDIVDPIIQHLTTTVKANPDTFNQLPPEQQTAVAQALQAEQSSADTVKKVVMVAGVGYLAFLLLKALGGKK